MKTIPRSQGGHRNIKAAGQGGIFVALAVGLTETLSRARGLALYDAFFRWCRDATDETHDWPKNKGSSK